MKVRTALVLIFSLYTDCWMIYQFIWGGVEPNPVIAIGEIALCAGFAGLVIERLLRLREK